MWATPIGICCLFCSCRSLGWSCTAMVAKEQGQGQVSHLDTIWVWTQGCGCTLPLLEMLVQLGRVQQWNMAQTPLFPFFITFAGQA